MGSDINEVRISGRLGRDPEIREAGKGLVANFSVAVAQWIRNKDGDGGEERTHWVNVEKWINDGDGMSELAKGDHVFVIGQVQYDQWESKEGEKRSALKVRANKIYRVAELRDPKSPSRRDNNSSRRDDNSSRRDNDRGGDSRSRSEMYDDDGDSGGGGGRFSRYSERSKR
jgi:single-strand DNA-binding protein